jgi:hypothetical protein
VLRRPARLLKEKVASHALICLPPTHWCLTKFQAARCFALIVRALVAYHCSNQCQSIQG